MHFINVLQALINVHGICNIETLSAYVQYSGHNCEFISMKFVKIKIQQNVNPQKLKCIW